MLKAAFPLSALIALAACGGQHSPAGNSAEALEQAAEQSDPAAAAVLENAADAMREGNVQDPAAAQQALEQAGQAQVQAGGGGQPQKAPDPAGAKPHAPGDPVPPPQTRSAPPATAGGAGTKAGGEQDHSGHNRL